MYNSTMPFANINIILYDFEQTPHSAAVYCILEYFNLIHCKTMVKGI